MTTLANGTYSAKPISWALCESQSGDLYVTVDFEIQLEIGVFAPDTQRMFLGLTDKAVGRTTEAEISINTLRALGFRSESLGDLSEEPPRSETVQVEIQNYTTKSGKPGVSIRIARTRPPVDVSKVKEIDRRLSGLLKASAHAVAKDVPF
jgi:hypothetical protein